VSHFVGLDLGQSAEHTARPSALGWTPRSDSATLVEHILSVVHYYRAGGYPAPIVRDVYYDLIGWYGYAMDEKFKRKVYRLLSKMRRSRMVAFDKISDDSSNSLVSRILTRRTPRRTLARERESIKNEEGVGLFRFPLHAASFVAPSRRVVPAYTGLGYAESAPYLLLG
jgi:hypothetical protein